MSIANREAMKHFCVVGLGDHASKKLIPALLSNRQKILGVVSRRDVKHFPEVRCFRGLDEALQKLPIDTVFVIATPPELHFEQAASIIMSERDVIIEKPAFIFFSEANLLTKMAAEKKTLLVEGMMHRHSELYRRVMLYWESEYSSVFGIEIDFLIPEIPARTFRSEKKIASSCLYDIGCYPISLLGDLNLPIQHIKLSGYQFYDEPIREIIELFGVLNGINVMIRVGTGLIYKNSVSFIHNTGSSISFSPFFFGRPGERKIIQKTEQGLDQEIIHDSNMFEAMFALPRSRWLANQPDRNSRMVEVTKVLEDLSHIIFSTKKHDKIF